MTIVPTRIHKTLPVFRLDSKERCVLYAPPGHLAVVEPDIADEIAEAWTRHTSPDDSPAQEVAAWLRRRAKQAVAQWQQGIVVPFSPGCLTIYLSNQCNLDCSYCYAAPKRQKQEQAPKQSPLVQQDAVLAAARLVAQHCAERQKPIYLVLHGGGEPTLHWELMQWCVAATRQIADQFGIAWQGYLATNGVLSEQQAQWIARHFPRVGLSSDGPPDIQNRQRPFPGGNATAAIIKRTARILRQEGVAYTIRATITPHIVERQAEIVAYFHEYLGAEDLRFEPVYEVRGNEQRGFQPADAEQFVEHFLQAQQEARSRGITLSFSGLRPEELHGPYCDVGRQVLHLNPDGTATACPFSVNGRGHPDSSLVVGAFDAKRDEFVLNYDRITAHQRQALTIPAPCSECLNIYHCVRGCPEFCLLTQPVLKAGSRCQVQRRLAYAWIFDAAQKIVAADISQPNLTPSFHDTQQHHPFMPYFRDLPSDIDQETIITQWQAIHNVYQITDRTMPPPVWAERNFEDKGSEAWQRLQDMIPSHHDTGAMAIYIHAPFCDRKCGFCDCYSLPFGKRRRQEQEGHYTHTLLNEMDAWLPIIPLHQRSVSTVHFGGGTPNCLSSDVLARIVEHCRRSFRVTPDTEWAIESTSSLLTDRHLRQLQSLGFTRLHVGVQTLEEPLRHTLGRRETAQGVLQKIRRSLDMGFVASVDIIYGLPGQTVPGFINTLTRLIESGIHGISLYRLNVSHRNRRFLENLRGFPGDPFYDYLLFQIAEQMLIQAGYQKNHFAHFARPEDQNLYYTHAKRGEDLLALGPTADGVFSDYHYRHPEYQEYTSRSSPEIPVLEGGLAETPSERFLRPVVASLMTGSLPQSLIETFHLEALIDRWTTTALLQKVQTSYILTANGTWFISDMIAELKRYPEHGSDNLER